MTRLEKKCLIASAGMHSVLILMLVVPPLLWKAKPQRIPLPPLQFIPSRLVDGATGGGGSPTAKAMPAPAPPAPIAEPEPEPIVRPPEPAVSQPKVEPAPAEVKAKEPDPAPAPSEKKIAKAPEREPAGESKPTRPKVEISFKRESGAAPRKSAAQARAQAAANARAAQAKYAARVNSIVGAIDDNVSSGTSIEIPGPGGEAFADYRQFLILAYKRAWTPPPELADELATVKVRVVVLRSGKVASFDILKKSGDAALDRSVARLDNVRQLPPFPEGATDAHRAFIINFNLTL